MTDLGTHNILGVNIAAVDYEAAVTRIVNAARDRRPFGVSALAVHGVMTGVMDPQHRHRLNHLEMLVPDGQPVRWALNWLHGARLSDRVYGPHLMLETCRAAEREALSIFLFGGTQELLDDLQRNLLSRFPELKIAGVMPSRFRRLQQSEKEEVVAAIRDSGADITCVGIGCPRQEVWTYEFKDALSMPVLAVGAAFNFHAGHLPQAPPRLQRLGLEWAYRLSREPRRLWRRYLLLNPYYLWLIFIQRTGLHTIDPAGSVPPKTEILYG